MSAAGAATALEKRGFDSVLVRQAPYTLQVQLSSDKSTLKSVKKQLAQMYLIGYEIDNRLMVGAYMGGKLDHRIMADQLTAAGFTTQVIQR